jgi:outer membrane protein TolC
MHIISRISLIPLTLWGLGASALNLGQAVEESLQNSPSVLKARSAAEEARWQKVESLQGFLPTVTAGATYLTQKKYMLINTDFGGNPVVFPSIIPTTNYTLTAQLPLFDGFASTNRYQAGSRQASAAVKDLNWTEFSASREVILLYYKALAAESLKEVAYQNMETLKDHQKDIMALKKVGISTRYDVLRTDTQVSEAESEIFNAEDNLELAKFRLGEALGKEKEERPLEGGLPVPDPEVLKKLKGLELNDRPDIQSLEDRVKAMEYRDKASGRYWVPRLSLFGQYQYYNNINDRFNDYDYFRNAYEVGFNLSWNLFDGMSSISRSQASEEELKQMQIGLHVSQLKASQDFEYWKRKFLYFCTVYKSRNADIARSNEAMRLAREGRKVGARTTADILDAELDLFRARAGLVNSQIGAIEALIRLELASGQKLYDYK